MAYHWEKNSNELVFDGWEKGIFPSPHSGIANMQAVNISTETGEVMCSYSRSQQTMTSTSATGSLTFADSTHVSLTIAGSTDLLKGMWITVSSSSHTGELPNGVYFVTLSSGSNFQLSPYYNGALTTGFTAGLTATFTLVRTFGQPIAYAIEQYQTSGTQYRYYVLDANALVWVYDTAIASTSSNIAWFLPDSSISYYTGIAPSGIGVLNGWLMVFAGNTIWVKKTVNLGGTTSTTTLWVAMTNAILMSQSTSSNPHSVLVGHQGKLYYTDGNYIGSIFPDTSLLSGVANIQSYAKYTSSSGTGTISPLYSGSVPSTGADVSQTGFKRIPAVFFTDQAGTQPSNLTVNTVYYIQYSLANGTFTVFSNLTNDTLTLTGGFGGGETTATLLSAFTGITGVYSVTFSNTDVRSVTFTNASTGISWTGGLSGAATDTITVTAGYPINITTGASGNQFFNTFFPVGTAAGAYGTTSTTTFTPQRVNLPTFEIAQCMAEIGNTVIIGGIGNILYPWNQIDVTPSTLIALPENKTATMITVNQMAYVFAGNKGNVYITDGSVASLVIKVPDYCAGIAGTQVSYIEPYFTWGGAAYIRGRVYFSILDQISGKAGNCGGIWSFVPTQNLYIGQDTGLALRLENQNSYGTYSGVATIIIPSQTQNAKSPQYWSGWYSSITSPAYGIDFTGTTFSTSAVIETDLASTGNILGEQKQTFANLEYKLAAPLEDGETITGKYRLNATDAFTTLGTFKVESTTGLSGYISPLPFEKTQWVQFQLTLNPSGAVDSSGCRLVDLRLRK